MAEVEDVAVEAAHGLEELAGGVGDGRGIGGHEEGVEVTLDGEVGGELFTGGGERDAPIET